MRISHSTPLLISAAACLMALAGCQTSGGSATGPGEMPLAASTTATAPSCSEPTAGTATTPTTTYVDSMPADSPVVGQTVVSAPTTTTTTPSASATSTTSTTSPIAASTLPSVPILLNASLEDQSTTCWNTRPNSGGFNNVGCGSFRNIGSWPLTLANGGIAHSGSKSVMITYTKNEDAGGTNVSIYADTVDVRSYYYFDQNFDFGQGMKIGRVSSFNAATQVNDIDIILQTRSAIGTNQCGMNDMHDLGLYYNGRPVGYDWGNVSANLSFQRGRWYAVEYQIILNTPYHSDGSARIWVDGQLVASRVGLNIRGTAGLATKLNTVKIGGWYSNGLGGNVCPNPSSPSRIYMDDIIIAKGYVGP